MVSCKLKGCPRCGGDIFIDRDQYGWYEYCIQCGYINDTKRSVKLGQHPDRDEKTKRIVTIPRKGK